MTWVCEEAYHLDFPGTTRHRDWQVRQPEPGWRVCGYETDDDTLALQHADVCGHVLRDYPHADRNLVAVRRCMPSDSVGSYAEDEYPHLGWLDRLRFQAQRRRLGQ